MPWLTVFRLTTRSAATVLLLVVVRLSLLLGPLLLLLLLLRAFGFGAIAAVTLSFAGRHRAFVCERRNASRAQISLAKVAWLVVGTCLTAFFGTPLSRCPLWLRGLQCKASLKQKIAESLRQVSAVDVQCDISTPTPQA